MGKQERIARRDARIAAAKADYHEARQGQHEVAGELREHVTNPSRKARNGFIILGAIVVTFAACSGGDPEPEAPSAVVELETEPEDEPEPQPEDEPEPQPEDEPELSIGQRNALAKAESYLSHTSFSRSGLIEQLEYEGFDTADAEFAVDAVEVDWNEQAAKKAESYLSHSSFSRDGLVRQLEYEGFTPEQVEHGVTEAGY